MGAAEERTDESISAHCMLSLICDLFRVSGSTGTRGLTPPRF